MVSIREDNVTAGEKLEEKVEEAIAEDDVNHSIGPNLGNRRDSPGFETFAQASHEAGGSSGCGAGVLCQMTSEARVDDQLLAMIRFGELEEEDALGHEREDISDSSVVGNKGCDRKRRRGGDAQMKGRRYSRPASSSAQH